MTRITLVHLVLLAATAAVVSSFVAPVHHHQQRQQQQALAYRTLLASTLQEQERLTNEEEAILFGDDDPQALLKSQSAPRQKNKYGVVLPGSNSPNPLDHSKNNPLINKLRTMRDTLESCPDLWLQLEQICPDKRALLDEHMCDTKLDLTFADVSDLVQKSAAVFAKLGVKKGVNVAVLGENSARWLLIDHGIQMAGGASAVRGADAPLDELRYIYEHSDSAGVVVLQGPKLLQKLHADAKAKNMKSLGLYNDKYGAVKTVILMNREKKSDADIQAMASEIGVQVKMFADLLDSAERIDPEQRPKLTRDDISTIVYTSGTTGRPKGVMLSHGALIHQISHRMAPSRPYEETDPLPGETMVSLLPVWHITERTFELWIASRACSVVYSSIRTFKNDLAKYQPQWMVLVPRVLEKIASGVQDKFASGGVAVKTLAKFFTSVGNTVATHKKIAQGLIVGDEAPGALERLYSNTVVTALAPVNAIGQKLIWKKVQDGFGGRLKVIISGGSALAGSLETFYETAGITICVGYGLTECAPLIAHRRSDSNLVAAGCVGKACSGTELRVVDPESKATDAGPRPSLPDGQVGVVIGRGPQVMKGYYKNPEATQKAIDKYGFFDTGDLGRINPATGDLILTGRAKDTIVLSNGENIEPQPIEDAILGESPLIDQVMLTGQDGRRLLAITVLSPNELANAELLDKEMASKLQAASDKVNDPKCTESECEANLSVLKEASAKLRTDAKIQQALQADVKRATSSFRKWEQVGDVYITLEPFAMANGQLTQSYKVKRDSVMSRYGDELPK